MIVVVSDTSTIRALHHVEKLRILGVLFQEVLIPPFVRNELELAPKDQVRVDVREFPFIQVQQLGDRSSVDRFLEDLDPGESEALALALEVCADFILMDEAAGRAKAKEVGLVPLGTLGVLIEAKRRGHVDLLAPLLDRLQHEFRFFISSRVREEVLKAAGE